VATLQNHLALWTVLAVAAMGVAPAWADEAPSAKQAAGDSAARLAAEQALIADRFRDLEKVLLRMADLTAHTDPRRAALLRQAITQSKDRDLDHKFDDVVNLLKQDRLAAGVKSQGELKTELAQLLELLLSEDRGKRLESEKQRIRDYLRKVNQIIKEQKGLQAETNDGAEGEKKLSPRQGELGDRTGQLGAEIAKNEGKPPDDKKADDKKSDDKKSDGKKPDDKNADEKPDDSAQGSDGKSTDGKNTDGNKPDAKAKEGKDGEKSEGKPSEQPPGEGKPSPGSPKPSQPGEGKDGKGGESAGDAPPPQDNSPPAEKRLREAQERMQQAQRNLDNAKRQGASEEQQKAIEALQKAKAELEAILRQLREEERSRVLAMLEARFRKMLDMQTQVYEGTKRLDHVADPDRDRDHEIESGRLSRKEAEIVGEADRALSVLREEGTSVAMPEAVGAMRDDMEQVVARLAQTKVGEVTQKVEEDVITALEELIAALKKAQKDLADKKPPPGQAGEASEPPLVDKIAELKVIRAMQMRVNTRTQRYYEIIKTEQAEQPDLLAALKRLAEREERIYRVTRDIVVGRTE
jgi:vacuolar-type H+-ATPase subunit H